jgi:hypothetical protein
MRSANTGELQGVPPLLVVDLSKGRAGALGAKLLGMGGANVIKLGTKSFVVSREPPGSPTNRCCTSIATPTRWAQSSNQKGVKVSQ